MIDTEITYVRQAMQYTSPKGVWNALFASNNFLSSQSQGNLNWSTGLILCTFFLCWIDKSSLIKALNI